MATRQYIITDAVYANETAVKDEILTGAVYMNETSTSATPPSSAVIYSFDQVGAHITRKITSLSY